jgi:PEP-CTERM motif
MATHSTWADCASAFASDDAVYSHRGDASAAQSFDAPMASIDFTPRGANAHQSGAAPGAVSATAPVAAIPEPHTNLLMLAGLAAIGFMATRRRRP